MNDISLTALSDLLQQIDRRKAGVGALRPFTPEQEGRIKEALAQIKARTAQ